MFDTDVFVLGGGPAGLAAAIAARRRGFSVTLADACLPPIDKACGEGLMPGSLAAAAELGIEIPAADGFPFRGVRFTDPRHSVSAAFPHGHGRGIRRTLLHSLLVDAAARIGVQMLWGVSVAGIDSHTVRLPPGRMPPGRTALGSVTARWIVGADGGQSMMRRWAGLPAMRLESRRFGFRTHYPIAPWSDYMEIHWSEGCQFYVTPVAPDEICLVLMSRDPHLRIAAALPLFPALFERLRDIPQSSPERGSYAATRRLPRITRGSMALVGDAAGTVDPITGEGMCLAFEQSLALADALAAGDLTRYETGHTRLARRPIRMARFLLTLDRSTWLRSRVLAAFSARPELFGDLLAAHLGRLDLPQLAATAAALGWEFATA